MANEIQQIIYEGSLDGKNVVTADLLNRALRALSGGLAPIYNANEIPYGDGSTAGGVTSPDFTWDSANKDFSVAPATIGYLQLNLNNTGNSFSVSELGLLGSTKGIFYAGSTSTGLSSPVTGLGIDILNDVYTLGNPATANTLLQINGTTNIVALGGGLILNQAGVTYSLGDIYGQATGEVFKVVGGGAFQFEVGTKINIGGKDIDFSAANAAGYWYNDGNGVISYQNPALLQPTLNQYQIPYGDAFNAPQSSVDLTFDTNKTFFAGDIGTGAGIHSNVLTDTYVLGNGNTSRIEVGSSATAGLYFNNGSRVQKGTTDAGTGGAKGVALRCSVDYELKWEAGSLYVMEQNGFTIREVSYKFTTTPTATDDDTKGFVVGSRWILDDGTIYVCSDNTTATAVWSIYGATGTFTTVDSKTVTVTNGIITSIV